jgi:hypothetical protein
MSQPAGRNAAHCLGWPLQRQGRASGASLAPQAQTLERRSLCQPSGPDGEGQARGQARSARGEPPRARSHLVAKTEKPRLRMLRPEDARDVCYASAGFGNQAP